MSDKSPNSDDRPNSEALERADDDFKRALRGERRPVPHIEGAPQGMAEELLDSFSRAYRYDEASGIPRDFHEAFALVIWSRVEPEAIRSLRVAVREIREDELVPGDEWIANARLREWAEGVVNLIDGMEERLAIEFELASREGGTADVQRLVKGLSTMVDDWEVGDTD